jgi:hypothetical protein
MDVGNSGFGSSTYRPLFYCTCRYKIGNFNTDKSVHTVSAMRQSFRNGKDHLSSNFM